MLKILYAADSRPTSFYSMKRFLDTYGKYYNIKTAAYSKSIKDINVNWNLDALLDFRGKYNSISFKNSNFALYVREIKRYSPHLILSDVEVYSSYVGLELGVPVWQVSPLLLYYGTEEKNNVYKYYSGTFSAISERYKYINYILGNSDKKIVLSHLGDVPERPVLKEGFQWARPNYHVLEDNSQCMRIPSTAIHLADAYFNNKPSVLDIDYTDLESIVIAQYNYNYGLSVSSKKNIIPFETTIDSNVKFLSQYLKELDI